MQKLNVGVVGVTGYAGMELVRILNEHPGFELGSVASRSHAGRALQELFPFFRGTCAGLMPVIYPDPELISRDCDLVFLAVPHKTAMDMAADFVSRKVKVVDLSADFRLRNDQVYTDWYEVEHTQLNLLQSSVYGLPEIYAQEIAQAELVANPGCYPTSVILALYPGLRHNLLDVREIIIDSKSGASGAGRSAKTATLFSEVADSLRGYSLGRHRHTPEMEQELSRAAGQEVLITFSPHLVPLNRGILSTCYVRLKEGADVNELRSAYQEFYRESPWVRVLPENVFPETRWVRGSMFCDLGFVMDKRTDRLIIVSCIDNLCRGASGQAVANANLMAGYEPGLGISNAPLMP